MIAEKNTVIGHRSLFIGRYRKYVFLLCSFLFLLIATRSSGIDAVNNLNFDFYSQEHGLSNNHIHCILQDKKGWMWFGTSQGVCRFDGYKFTVFKNDVEDTASLKGNLVRTIFEDSKGQLWVGTENGGLNKFNREKENFQHLFYSGNQAVLRDASVTSVHEDLAGNLYVGTETHLFRMENENILVEINPSERTNFTEYFRVIQTDHSGKIWLGTNNGLFTIHPNTLEIKPVELDRNNDRSLTVRAVAKDRNGKYWVGTRGGLYVFEKNKGVAAFYYHDEREPKSLVNNSIQHILHDVKGDVWIGTRNGINFLIEERQSIQGYKSMQGDNRYLNSSEIFAFWMDRKGDIWAGTESGGINILDRKTGRFKYLMPQKGNPNSLSRNCIKALLDDGKNNLWIGTFLGGIDVMNLQTGTFKHYVNNPNDPSSLSDNRVWALLSDSKTIKFCGLIRI